MQAARRPEGRREVRHSWTDDECCGHSRMEAAIDVDPPGFDKGNTALLIRLEIDIEGFVARSRSVAEQIVIGPDDRVAHPDSIRRGTKFHLIDNDHMRSGLGPGSKHREE